ncbi:YslB family protein [Gracilibacillus sp. S3-1-1]|uniref:YslB family protein n=1 Tax=Gracilibacillus pellucidus TaxID=3095368 RepID=A0ACC6M6N6_9BACI|nr:YslB family protein [Gracilibacillus sp. S3-1-1]MDX8046641.1 YslB family protein [Gracilibacillus sp. S3-1-1]
MVDKKTNIATVLANLQTTSSGYDLIRYIGLPDMLGQESDLILYVMGKNIARQAECGSLEEIKEFFQHVGWGDLLIVKEKRNGYIYEISGELVQARKETLGEIDFQLEAGFLAEAIYHITEKECECVAEVKKGQVLLHVLHN